MYIASLRIENYRSFRDILIEFNPGVNALIGENNSGKTTVLHAMALLFGRQGRSRPTVSDFHRCSSNGETPPTIRITATIRSSGATDTLEDRALVATWLTKLEGLWEASLTYLFALPEDEHAGFKMALGDNATVDRYWAVVDEFLPRYIYRVLGGNPDSQLRADGDALAKFDYQFLDALRDADSEMLVGSAPLLKSMLVGALDKDKDAVTRASLREQFKIASSQLIGQLIGRIDLSELLALATSTGAEDGGSPALAGLLQESDLLSALGLVVKRGDVMLPASHNGLGYKNLLYMSLVMARIEVAASRERRGQNATVFPMLVIEEPEAHLHPTQQYKLLKYINDRLKAGAKCRQVFISTHSTHITSAVGLDAIIWLAPPSTQTPTRIGYPGRCYPKTDEWQKSKRYVERFLDATKSNMLFAKGILLVEGVAEQLLLPVFADYLGVSLATHHVATIAVNGSNFRHFLPLFGGTDLAEARTWAIRRRIACVIDADPSRKAKAPKSRFGKCWPYQLDQDVAAYEYKPHSCVVGALQEDCIKHADNLKIFCGQKTLEYDLAMANMESSLLIGPTCDHQEALKAFIDAPAAVPAPPACALLEDARSSLAQVVNAGDERKRTRYATCYLCCVETAKGEHAFALSHSLRANLELKEAERRAFAVPGYLKEAIEWICSPMEV